MNKISVNTLITVLKQLGDIDLCNASRVCKAWRDASVSNTSWLERFRCISVTVSMQKIQTLIEEMEETKKQIDRGLEEEQNLTQQVKTLDRKIALLVGHTCKLIHCPATPINKINFQGSQSKYKITAMPQRQSCMVSSSPSFCSTSSQYLVERGRALSITGRSDNIRSLRTRMEIMQIIVAVVGELNDINVDEIQNATLLFKYLSRSKVATKPQFLFNASEIFMFIKGCDTAYKKDTGFLKAVYIAVKKEMETLIRKQTVGDELNKVLNKVALLNDQLAAYDNIAKEILFGYSHMCKADPVKFSLKKLSKKGVVVSCSAATKERKNTTFSIIYAINGIFQMTMKISEKVTDIVHIDMALLLEKLGQSCTMLQYSCFSVNIACILRLLEKHLLKAKTSVKEVHMPRQSVSYGICRFNTA